MNPPEAEVPNKRRSRPIVGRLRRSDDQYGLVLIAILVTLVVMGVVTERALGEMIIPVSVSWRSSSSLC